MEPHDLLGQTRVAGAEVVEAVDRALVQIGREHRSREQRDLAARERREDQILAADRRDRRSGAGRDHEEERLAAADMSPGYTFVPQANDVAAFVLAKFDTLRDEVLSRLGLHRGFPPRNEKRKRKEYAEALLRAFLPQTLSQIRGGKVAGVSMDQAAYFLSWVKTEKQEGMEAVGAPRIVRTGFRPGAGGDPDFAYDEYVAFIEHFRELAHKIPDEVAGGEQIQAAD